MAKILEFKRKQEVQKPRHVSVESDDLEDEINAIMSDYSLPPANRRWLLENMLAEIEEQLEEYKQGLESAETKLDTLVKSAETDIVAAYADFEAQVRGMTRAVEKLTKRRRSRQQQVADAGTPPPQSKP
jgi:hypothetical protein